MNKKKIIINEVAKILKIKPSNIKTNFKIGDIKNWDSFNHIKIYIELSKIFKYKGKTDNLAKVKSIGDWINFFK